jgi:hypothetical protein
MDQGYGPPADSEIPVACLPARLSELEALNASKDAYIEAILAENRVKVDDLGELQKRYDMLHDLWKRTDADHKFLMEQHAAVLSMGRDLEPDYEQVAAEHPELLQPAGGPEAERTKEAIERMKQRAAQSADLPEAESYEHNEQSTINAALIDFWISTDTESGSLRQTFELTHTVTVAVGETTKTYSGTLIIR